jgi:transcriptional regulator
MTDKAKTEQLEWRRSKVVEMRAKGMSQIEIAHELQVSELQLVLICNTCSAKLGLIAL